MDTQLQHGILPHSSHDEQALQMFVKSFRGHLAGSVAPGNKRIYDGVVLPNFEQEKGRPPADKGEVRSEMIRQPYYQFWSALQRASQELMWDSVIDTVERTLPQLQSKARDLPEVGGSLTLDPALEIPGYHTAVDIHLQPGAYHSEHTDDDLSAGAIYDRGVYLYLTGGTGPKNDLLGRILINFFKENYTDRKVGKLLDMGCAIGNSTLPWGEAFPDTDIYGLDVAAPVLRYAHARAKAMGRAAHFSQQNAEKTNFDADSFDIIVSHIMLHETSRAALPGIFAECRRILKPGGLMLHLEVPRPSDPFNGFLFDWESYNNNEPFSRPFRELDIVQIASDAGMVNARIELAPVDFQKSQRNYSEAFVGFPVLVGEKA